MVARIWVGEGRDGVGAHVQIFFCLTISGEGGEEQVEWGRGAVAAQGDACNPQERTGYKGAG